MLDNCSFVFDEYLNGSSPDCLPRHVGCLPGNVVNCILNNAPESLKANTAAAAVLLGLLPTTLSLVGSSTIETGLLALRRPALAGLLAAGAPAVSPIRTFEYCDPKDILRTHGDDITWT